MTEEIYYADATGLARRIAARELSPVEVVESFLRRIDEVNPKINAVVTLADDALEQAREAEARLSDGAALGPMHGVPFTVKDCVDTVGVRTTQRLPALRGVRPYAGRHRRLEAQAGGRHHARQDEHARVRPLVGDG